MSEINPDFHTSPEDYSAAEKAKRSTDGLKLVIKDIRSPSNLSYQFKDTSAEDLSEVAETLAKSYGIYLEFNRAKTGSEKDWMYMIRITIPGGGPLSRKQWAILDDVSEKYTQTDSYTGKVQPTLRLTTRQNLQLHWVKKKHLADLVREIANSGFYSLNGCGDNVRNVMGCPLSRYSNLFDANALAQKVGKYFQLPSSAYMEIFEIDPKFQRMDESISESETGCGGPSRFEYGAGLLNRKFKIAFSAIHRDEKTGKYLPDNCVELRTNDIGIAPILENSKVEKFQVFVGGSQGEKAGHATFAAMGVPFGIFSEANLIAGLDAIVQVHKEWGDRKNRHWARMKYVIYKMGIEWYRQRVKQLGADFEAPIEEFDYGPRFMHHGWTKQDANELWVFGAFIENGRIVDGHNGNLKTMVRYLMDNYPIELLSTPNQDLVFGNIPEDLKARFSQDLSTFGYGLRNGRSYSTLRSLSGACVGRDTCRLTYTDSEKFEPYLVDLLEQKWGHLAESIGITGCEKQCFRPATKTIGWVGSGLNMYALKLGGTEDGRHQGGLLLDPETQQIYLKTVPRKDVPIVTDALFEFYSSNMLPSEMRSGSMGYFFKRVGPTEIISWLKRNPRTASLMTRTIRNPLALEKDSGLVNPSLSER